MKLNPKYSYEFNCILNESFNEDENIKNFASLLTDKDRFLALFNILERNSKLIEEKLGFSLPEILDFYIVRAEKFDSFSEPISIEYKLVPEEMILFLLKEIVKVHFLIRFPDEIKREGFLNGFIIYLIKNFDFDELNKDELLQRLHDSSSKNLNSYEPLDVELEDLTLKDYVEKYYDENPLF